MEEVVSQPRTLFQLSGKPMKTRPAGDAEMKRGGCEEMGEAQPLCCLKATCDLDGDKN
jgi:hypothetical protein